MIRRKKRKHCVREGKPLVVRTSANQEWALDFAHDAVACGRAIRVLSVVDAYTRECLALEVDKLCSHIPYTEANESYCSTRYRICYNVSLYRVVASLLVGDSPSVTLTATRSTRSVEFNG